MTAEIDLRDSSTTTLFGELITPHRRLRSRVIKFGRHWFACFQGSGGGPAMHNRLPQSLQQLHRIFCFFGCLSHLQALIAGACLVFLPGMSSKKGWKEMDKYRTRTVFKSHISKCAELHFDLISTIICFHWQHRDGESFKLSPFFFRFLLNAQAEAVAVLGAVAAVLQLSNTGLNAIAKLKDAYNHYHKRSTLFDRCQDELRRIKGLVKLVKKESALHIPAVTIALNSLKVPEERLERWLPKLDTENKGAVHSFLRELKHGSDNRKKLEAIMKELDRAKRHLDSVIQIRHVEMSRKRDEKVVANSSAKAKAGQKHKKSPSEIEGTNKVASRRSRRAGESIALRIWERKTNSL
jgi:hypothetical protein